MSVQRIQQYHTQVEKIIRYGGSRNESSVRKPFQDLLEYYAQARNLEMIAELDYRTPYNTTVYPDGTLKDALRLDWGYWESKDEKDTLSDEIENKFAKGYPNNNIIFEDTHTAVLYQGGREVERADLKDAPALDALLTRFVSYEPVDVREFRTAIEEFAAEVPALAEELRDIIREQLAQNTHFKAAAQTFLDLCQKAINPNVDIADVREMIIQHTLTQDIFIKIFDEPQFHQENNIAHKLGEVVNTFYHGATRRTINDRLGHYYATINARASRINNHHEKQKFLKALYENFYKAYNPKGADRLGIVYTPNEIVRFMLEATDTLCYRHFGKTLGDENVHILDPATGTGTFITELLEYLPPHHLQHKYQHEIHCNEVAILPYYIANLNIEYTYRQKMGHYQPFENIVFVDTLDNMGFQFGNKQTDFFHLADENVERIDRQNEKQISVIIGNPPYNANQLNENENNKNREYPEIDKRIKDTYVKYSTAQKTKLYDMYARFLRWASDRLTDNGIIAFVTNNSFINARTFDGFRKVVAKEFSEIYIVDLKGNSRTTGESARQEGGNIFNVRVGIAVYFLIKRKDAEECRIYYNAIQDYASSEDKKAYLRDNSFQDLVFEHIRPSRQHYWIKQTENDWEDLLPIATKKTKYADTHQEIDAIFELYSLGIATNRDDWVYDWDKIMLQTKIEFFLDTYHKEQMRWEKSDKTEAINDFVDRTIKWTSELENYLKKGIRLEFKENRITQTLYRPFVKKYLYYDHIIIHRLYQLPNIFPIGKQNLAIWMKLGRAWPFFVLAIDLAPDLLPQGGSQCLPLYRYTEDGQRLDNITDFALKEFQTRYDDEAISKRDIFHYVYAVLHHPAYRQTYELNLKREFPRLPFYENFGQWAAWGQQLMELHLNFESVAPYPLLREEKDPDDVRKAYKASLRANKTKQTITLDTLTTLGDIPPSAWDYKLGNRSALEWVLDRYKERKPRDPTIREKFNSYRFADYKEQVIDLLRRVTTVSVETMQIVEAMPDEGPQRKP